MKKILVLIIFFMDFTFISARSTSEIMSSYPATVSMQRQKLSNVISPLGAGKSEKIQKIMHRVGSIDSNCIKNLHNQFRYNNRSVYRRPFEMIRPLRIQAFRNDGNNQPMQISRFHKMRQNQLKEPQNRNPFGNDRIIFLTPYVKLNEKRANFTQIANEYKINKTSQSDSREDLTSSNSKKITNEQEILIDEKLKKKEENTKNVGTFTSDEENRKNEEPHLLGNSTVFVEVRNVSKTSSVDGKPSETPYTSHEFKSTTATNSRISPHHFWQKRPTPIQPYEVEEIIEEELSVDLNNEKTDNLKNSPFNGPTFPGEEIIRQGLTGSENGQKINGFHDIMGSSINSVLKSLVSPMLKVFPTVESNSETFPKEKIQNRPVHSFYFTTTSPRFATFSSRKIPDFRKITNSYRSLPNRHEQAKHLKIADPQSSERIQNWTRKTTESIAENEKIIPEMNYDSKFNKTSALTVGYSKNAHTTDTAEILYTPLRILKTDKNIPSVKENLQQKTTAMTEKEISSSSESSPKLNNLSSFTTLETQKAATGFTVERTSRTEIENPPVPSFESSKNQTTFSKISLSTQGLTTVKSTSIDSPNGFTEMSTEEPETLSEARNVKLGFDEPFSEISVNEKELTTPDFQEFTDFPMTFDLLTTMKSDLKKNQDVIGKNSRKMHFGREPLKVTTASPIAEMESTGPRRSDILITENFDEYVDVDNNLSTLNYLYKLKQINSFPSQNTPPNSTFIPLIPTIINDLREGKISLEDVSILSEALGEYWPSITVLANSTNLDMLPLLKMKKEEDWKNILQNFLLENTEPTTLKTKDTHPNEGDDYSPYDYLDEYKDFYEYVFDSEEKEKKRKKARPKRDEEDNLQKIEESREYFENTEEEQIPSNGKEYENIFYNETSEGEDASGFDTKLKMADLNMNLHNVTSQTRIDIF